jgi:methionyl-tRNA synthetase
VAEIIALVYSTNKYVNDNAPWTLAKENKMQECGQVLYSVLDLMVTVCILILPYCPNIAKNMAKQLKINPDIKLDELKGKMLASGKLITKDEIKPVFLRLDSEFAIKK